MGDSSAAYRAAFERWMDDLRQVHAVLLDGERLEPIKRIALLRRESHSKERYEQERARLLGLPADDTPDPFAGSGSSGS